MREKLLWSIVVLLGLMLAFAHAQSPARTETQVGRYQIVTVSGTSDEQAQVFRIDTATGKTWAKALIQQGAKPMIMFAVIPDAPAGSLTVGRPAN